MTIDPPCFGCRHFDRAGSAAGAKMVCAAFPFPAGIPRAILLAEFDHREPWPGDGGIRFEPGPIEARNPMI